MKQKMIILIFALLSSVCQAKEEGDTARTHVSDHFITQGDPARLFPQNDTILKGYIIGKIINGRDTAMSVIVVQDVIRTENGDLLATGGFWGTVFFGDSACKSRGEYDCFAVRFSRQGVLTWLRLRGSPGRDIGHGIAVGPTGMIYVVGVFDDSMFTFYHYPKTHPGMKGTDGFLLTYDPSSLYCNTKVIVAGPGIDGAFAVTTDIWGNVYVTGTFRGTALIGRETCTAAGNNDSLGDVFMVKLSLGGTYLITQTYGTEYADERGTYIGVGYNTQIITIFFDINIADAPIGDLWFDDYGMRKDAVHVDVCNACIEYYFQKLNLSLEKNTTR